MKKTITMEVLLLFSGMVFTQHADAASAIPRDAEIYNLQVDVYDNTNDGLNSINVEDRLYDRECDCGLNVTNNGVSNRVTNGHPTKHHKFQVKLRIAYSSKYFGCGGTVLNRKYVLTAAHCLRFHKGSIASRVTAEFGEHYDSNKNIVFDQQIEADRILISPNSVNDVAMLRMSRDIIFNQYVTPACLPRSSNEDYTHGLAHASGWGRTEIPYERQYLKEVDLRLLTNQKCLEHGSFYIDERTQICAIGVEAGGSVCVGDSGGPLYRMQNDRMTVIGISSFVSHGPGHNCNSTMGFAKVSALLGCIRNTIRDGWC